MLPVACSTREQVISIMTPTENTITIIKYCEPIVNTAASWVNRPTNGFARNRPTSMHSAMLINDSTIPVFAAILASSRRFSPNRRAISALVPTPTPSASAMISICSGKAIETATSASSLTCATKILSTTLYNDCTSMEKIAGTDMLKSSLPTGIVPILSELNLLIKPLLS